MRTITYQKIFTISLTLLLSIILFSMNQSRPTVQAQNNSPNHIEIVGGEDVPDPNPYVWQVSIGYRNVPNENDQALGHFCGGSVIAEHWILTAAHCMEYLPGVREDPEDLRVIIGRRVRSKADDGIEINVKSYTTHQSYRSVDGGYDIALVELMEPIPNYIRYMIPLMRSELEESLAPPERLSIVTGWGGLKGYGANNFPPRDQTFADVLQWVEIPIVSQAVCNFALGGGIQASMLCAGLPDGGKDACQNDSGGPLVVPNSADGYVQLGIVSFGVGCAASNNYGVYTRVSSYIGWIEENANITLISAQPTPTPTLVFTSTATFTPTSTFVPAETETLMPADTPTATIDTTVTPTIVVSTTVTPTTVTPTTVIETETLMPTSTPTATVVATATPSATSIFKEPQLNLEIDLAQDPIYDPADLFDVVGPAPSVITSTESVSITLGITLMNGTPTAGRVMRFELAFENGGITLHGVVIEATVPRYSHFYSSNSGLLSYIVSDSEHDENEYSKFVEVRGSEWELSDGSAACPEQHSGEGACLFRLGTVGSGEKGLLAFTILVDTDVERDTVIEMEVTLMAGNLMDKTLIHLGASRAIEIIEPLSDMPTSLGYAQEPLGHHALFLPLIQR